MMRLRNSRFGYWLGGGKLKKGAVTMNLPLLDGNECCKCRKVEAVTWLHGYGYCQKCKEDLGRILLENLDEEELRLTNKRDFAESKPCVLVELTGNIRGFPHNMRNPNKTVFVCLDCFNTSYPEPFYSANVIPFEEEPVVGLHLCEVCNCDVYRL